MKPITQRQVTQKPVAATSETAPPDVAVLPQIDPNDAFSVVSGPNRQGMNFPLGTESRPKTTVFAITLPCGKFYVGLELDRDYRYSPINVNTMFVHGSVVDVDCCDKFLTPHQQPWAIALKNCSVRLIYDLTARTGKLFLKQPAIASA